MIKRIFSEELIVVFLILGALSVAFTPFLYEVKMANKYLSPGRSAIFEGDFPPDLRVYFSRMMEGYQGQWLVTEKYTSEPHRPSLLHWLYLLMGKAGRLFKIPPYQAFPFWRLVSGLVFLLSGYFFLYSFFKEKRLRLAAFILFVFVGNFPLLAPRSPAELDEVGISFLGKNFSFALGWYTFFDPLKRLVFLPHYLLSSALLIFAFIFWARRRFSLSGFFAFLAGFVLPQTLLIYILTLFFLNLTQVKEKGLKSLISSQWLLWLWLVFALILLKFSLSYFPWDAQTQADLSKRGEVSFRFGEYLLGLGTTGWFGFLAGFYLILRQKKEFFLPTFWLAAVLLLLIVFGIFPFSNQFRLTQVDLHLPLAVTSVVFLNDFSVFFRRRKRFFFALGIFLLLLPSFLTWPISLKSQLLFINSKIAAGYPLLPQLPYVVYPAKEVMEAIFWLGKNTAPDSVVLAAETVGSMIPAYAGNYVYLGHGHQTVNFSLKMEKMKNFYQGKMKGQSAEFLRENRISWIFYGPEEQQVGKEKLFLEPFLIPVFSNSLVKIYKVEL